MQNLLSLHELVKARLHCRAMHEGSDPTATLILRLIASNHATARLALLDGDCLSVPMFTYPCSVCCLLSDEYAIRLPRIMYASYEEQTNHVCIYSYASRHWLRYSDTAYSVLHIQTFASWLALRIWSFTRSCRPATS